jgi:penicillin-binding protein 1C
MPLPIMPPPIMPPPITPPPIGAPPIIWMVNCAPVGEPELRRQSQWRPDGAGFARVSVIDAMGASDSVLVRLE